MVFLGCLLISFVSFDLITEVKAQSVTACTKNPGNPILTPGPQGTWDSGAVGEEFVSYNGTYYNMWYSTTSTELAIGFASSRDGVHWTKYGSPALTAGPKGSWDQGEVEAPTVIWNGTIFSLYFVGSNGTLASDVGVAFSKDMIHWREYAHNPILTRGPSPYDSYYVKYPSVIYDPPTYKMWYTARASAGLVNGTYDTIAYATSSDGVHWTKYPGNPVITPSTSGKDGFYTGAKYPNVLKLGGTYVMLLLFTDGADTISYATSTDGVRWNSTGTALLSNTNNTGDWDFVPYYPSAVLNGTTLLLWYSGRTETSFSPPPSIGVAYCPVLLVSSNTTVTKTIISTSTSTSTTTMVSLSTVLQTVTTTMELGTSSSSAYELSTIILGILLVVAVALLYLKNRSQ
jgi:predicted GH43/DUF377 family glycosyl hydrolase